METKRKIKVFLVDDDNMFIKALKHQLSKEKTNIEIIAFPTGEECVQNLHQRPALIVLDYNLNSNYPDAMDGIEVLKKIKHKAPDTEVIMLSSQDNIEVAMDTLRNGAYDYITKSESCFMKIQNIIRHITDEISYSENVNKESKRDRIIGTVVIIILVIIIFLRNILS